MSNSSDRTLTKFRIMIHTLHEPISLPPVNGIIQREVLRGSNLEEVTGQVNGERGSKEKD